MYNREYISGKVVVRAACALLLAALLAVFMSGCRYTDILTEHIEDPDRGVVDEAQEPIYEENPNAPLDPDHMNREVSEAPDEDTQIEALPHYDPDAPDNGPTKRMVHKDDTPKQDEAAEGQEESGSNNAEGQGDDQGSDTGTGDDLTSDEANADGNQSDDAGIGGDTVIVSDEGTTDEPTAKGTVAAVGQYATITQMLGGAGSLVACDQQWYDSAHAQGLFNGALGDELITVQVAWSGDGAEAGQTNIDALVNVIKPAVVLWDGSSPALTADDRAQLEAAGITVQMVPTLGKPDTEDASVRQAVIEVAGILQDVSTKQLDAAGMRDDYLQFHDDTLRACYENNGNAYSYKASDGSSPHLYQKTPLSGLENYTNARTTIVYVDGWWYSGASRSTVSQQITAGTGINTETVTLPHDGQSLDVSDGVGLSIAGSADNYMVLDYYLQFAGIVNNAYDLSKPSPEGKPYLLIAGRATDIGLGGAFQARTGVDSALWYNDGDSTVRGNWRVLGDGNFPALLTNGEAAEDIAGHIVASASKPDGLYNIGQSYQVITVPSGVAGNWAYGTVESFLVAPWSYRLGGSENLAAAADYAAQFYSYFYRCDNWSGVVRNWDSAYTAG